MDDKPPTLSDVLDLLTATHNRLVEMWQAMPIGQARDVVWRAAEQVSEARRTAQGF